MFSTQPYLKICSTQRSVCPSEIYKSICNAVAAPTSLLDTVKATVDVEIPTRTASSSRSLSFLNAVSEVTLAMATGLPIVLLTVTLLALEGGGIPRRRNDMDQDDMVTHEESTTHERSTRREMSDMDDEGPSTTLVTSTRRRVVVPSSESQNGRRRNSQRSYVALVLLEPDLASTVA